MWPSELMFFDFDANIPDEAQSFTSPFGGVAVVFSSLTVLTVTAVRLKLAMKSAKAISTI
ncbi:hypothetical protein KXD40_009408 [Peronospora effusa]|uniref:Uncharacterized protein n=1 Tax=Peronospora effusa TaxID=542832 RepID=A0A3M6V945_9STRA|nr:hypothetical protein DD238_008294 [Peronospora effusa]RQM18776.1 hypothetical protein DD237_008197 [Peronospora effusa]UIZ28713.1 hypothetical protein KXD40_009408 [Peronospora effusa]